MSIFFPAVWAVVLTIISLRAIIIAMAIDSRFVFHRLSYCIY